MKKLLILVMVLAMASLASATLKISVNGTVDPPDSTINLDGLVPSATVVLDIHNLGGELADTPAFLVITGPATVNLDTAVNYVVPGAIMIWSGDPADGAVFVDLALVVVPAPALPLGLLADGIVLHCEGLGDVTIDLYVDRGAGLELKDSQVIHQIPEPVTIALLGLGGLLLRRRIA